MKRFALALALLASAVFAVQTAPAQASSRPTPTPAPTPTPVADPAITRLARQQFVAWQAGNVNRSLYSPAVIPKLTDAKVSDVSHALGALGPLTNTVFMGPFAAEDIPPDAHGYIYQMQCAEGAIYQWMIVDGQGKIATIFFKDKLDVETLVGTPAPNPPPNPSPT